MDELREELESAFNEEEEKDDQHEPNEQDTGSDESEDESTDGDTTETETETEGEEEAEGKDEEGDGDPDGAGLGDGDGKSTPSGINAPLGFSPEAREQWKKVPDTVKAQVHKREQEIEEAMRGTAEARRSHSALTELASSYAPILAAEGAQNPMQAIEGLFRTVAELRVGSPQQRAMKMAGLINHYGVDVSMLDSALVGEEPTTPEVTQMKQMLDQRLAPLQDMLQGQKQQEQYKQQATQEAVNNELQEFSKDAEFLNDVRNDMADLIDLASKQGRKMGFKEAYDKSCAMNPSISKVLSDRDKAAALKNSGKRVNGKLNASSSLRSKSASLSADSAEQSLRGEIESLWETYE